MTTANRAVAHTLCDAVIAGDFDTVLSVFHDECVVHESPVLPYGGDWKGPEGFAQLFAVISTMFTLSIDRYEVFGDGDTVAVRADTTFTSLASGTSLQTAVVEVYRIADGKIIDADIFYKDASAITRLAGPVS
jgi:hypothetical protein